MKTIKQILLVIILLNIMPFQNFACSAYKICINEKVYVGKNFDWYSEEGYIIKNNRNVEKYSYQSYEGTPASWTSKYGSITFNQIGKEFPYGGINEKGLVVEQLWLKDTRYPKGNDEISKVSELEWIQYQLDNFSTVEEVIGNLENLIIDPIYSKIHYFITDQKGQSVIIDFIDGEIVVSKNSGKMQVITNSAKQYSDKYYNKMLKRMDEIKPEARHTLHRFCLVKNQVIDQLDKSDFIQRDIFDVLNTVAENQSVYKTQWTITYNLTDLEIQFKSYNSTEIKTIQLSELDFAQESPVVYRLINSNEKGNVKEVFKPYSNEENRTLLENSLKNLSLEFDIEELIAHQMMPSLYHKDLTFINAYYDLEIVFNIVETTGRIKYYVSNSELNFKRRIPTGSGDFIVGKNKHTEILYSLPKGEYGLGSFHDVNRNGRLDFNFMHIPKEPFAFSNGAKGFFGLSPKFDKAKFDLVGDERITISIK